MSSHETILGLLPLSAAGVLEAAEERAVREHVHHCAECAARLESLGALASALTGLPSPAPPPDLALRTQALVAADLATAGDRRQGALLAIAAALLGWISWLGLWSTYRLFAGAWPSLWVWVAVSFAMALLSAPVAAALHKSRRAERSL